MLKKSQRTRKRVKKVSNSVLGDFFDTFLTLRAWRPGKTFLRLFGDFGARGVEVLHTLGALSGIVGKPTVCADELFGDFGSVARTEIHNTWNNEREVASRRTQGLSA